MVYWIVTVRHAYNHKLIVSFVILVTYPVTNNVNNIPTHNLQWITKQSVKLYVIQTIKQLSIKGTTIEIVKKYRCVFLSRVANDDFYRTKICSCDFDVGFYNESSSD